MPYGVQLTHRAQRGLEGLPERVHERMLAALAILEQDPRPQGSLRIRSRAPAWRVRVGDYRIIYAIFDPDQLVLVGAIERRSERTYRNVEELFR